jgi:hypothetical protein
MRWTTLFTAACSLAAASAAVGVLAPDRRAVARDEAVSAPAPASAGAAGDCLGCHPSAAPMLATAMTTRAAERGFCRRALGAEGGERFFAQSCTGCHVDGCADCHGAAPHASASARPSTEACLRCHRGYFVGWEYLGRAPREDHVRYQRGPEAHGERYLTMLPDVHAERGMTCADCHTMRALQQGSGKTAKACVECHRRVSRDVPEHGIAAHLERMQCAACHSAWAAQEYGTFLVRNAPGDEQEIFDAALPAWGEWRKSAVLKRQDAPPLGRDARGKVAPIRPQFVLFATDASRGMENRLLAAEWRAFFPHTVRRGTVTCGGCHESPGRYLLERDEDRHYLLEKDGLPLRSFWSQEGQEVVNGSFLSREEHDRMNRKTPEYVRQHLRQWKNLLDRADRRSAP